MPLGYGYVEREASDYVDWSKISSDLSKTLQDENKRREDLKDALDKQLSEDMNFIARPPQGEHISGNQFTQKYASDVSQYMLMQNKLLKSGQLDLKQYKINTQNAMDDTKNMFDITKKFQESYKGTMDRYKNGQSQKFELFARANIEGFSDFSQSEAYIDPNSGRVMISKRKVKKIVDGKEIYTPSTDPNDLVSVSTLLDQATAQYNKFDTDAALNSYADSLGKEIQSVVQAGSATRAGQVISLQDIMSKKYYDEADPATKKIIYDYKNAESNAIDALLVNPYNRTSVLTENIKSIDGKPVEYTLDENDAKANKNKILLKVDPRSGGLTPDFENSPHGKEQFQMAKDWLTEQARSRYDKVRGVETFQEPTPRAPTAAELDRADARKRLKDAATIIGDLYSGSDAAINTALSYVVSNGKGVVDATRTANGVTIYRVNENTGKIESMDLDFKTDGKQIGRRNFVNKAVSEVLGIPDVNLIGQIAGTQEGELNTSPKSFRSSRKQIVKSKTPTTTTNYMTFGGGEETVEAKPYVNLGETKSGAGDDIFKQGGAVNKKF